MKIMDMPTKKACEVMVDIAEPIARIACDEHLAESIKKMGTPEEKQMNYIAYIGKYYNTLIPCVMGEHYDDICRIASLLSGKSIQEIDRQCIRDTINDIKSSIDSELLQLFTLAGK